MSRSWYYEEYDDQSADEFDYVSVEGRDPVPITDLIYQVAEYRRLFGNDVTIFVYRSAGALCGVAT